MSSKNTPLDEYTQNVYRLASRTVDRSRGPCDDLGVGGEVHFLRTSDADLWGLAEHPSYGPRGQVSRPPEKSGRKSRKSSRKSGSNNEDSVLAGLDGYIYSVPNRTTGPSMPSSMPPSSLY